MNKELMENKSERIKRLNLLEKIGQIGIHINFLQSVYFMTESKISGNQKDAEKCLSVLHLRMDKTTNTLKLDESALQKSLESVIIMIFNEIKLEKGGNGRRSAKLGESEKNKFTITDRNNYFFLKHEGYLGIYNANQMHLNIAKLELVVESVHVDVSIPNIANMIIYQFAICIKDNSTFVQLGKIYSGAKSDDSVCSG